MIGRQGYIAEEKKTSVGLTIPYDVSLLFPVLFLVGIACGHGLQRQFGRGSEKYGSDYYFLKKQALFR